MKYIIDSIAIGDMKEKVADIKKRINYRRVSREIMELGRVFNKGVGCTDCRYSHQKQAYSTYFCDMHGFTCVEGFKCDDHENMRGRILGWKRSCKSSR